LEKCLEINNRAGMFIPDPRVNGQILHPSIKIFKKGTVYGKVMIMAGEPGGLGLESWSNYIRGLLNQPEDQL